MLVAKRLPSPPMGVRRLIGARPRSADTADPMHPHEPSDAMAADPKPVGAQILMNPRTPIEASRRLVAGSV